MVFIAFLTFLTDVTHCPRPLERETKSTKKTQLERVCTHTRQAKEKVMIVVHENHEKTPKRLEATNFRRDKTA